MRPYSTSSVRRAVPPKESGAEGAGAQQEADASAGQGGGRHHGGHGWKGGVGKGGYEMSKSIFSK